MSRPRNDILAMGVVSVDPRAGQVAASSHWSREKQIEEVIAKQTIGPQCTSSSTRPPRSPSWVVQLFVVSEEFESYSEPEAIRTSAVGGVRRCSKRPTSAVKTGGAGASNVSASSRAGCRKDKDLACNAKRRCVRSAGCCHGWGRRLGGRCRAGTAQDSLLRSRQGAPQHRTLRPRARRDDDNAGGALRCQSPFRPLSPQRPCAW